VDAEKPALSFFDELTRRKVFRVVAAYVVGAWVLVQVADLVADNFNAPDWVMQMIITLLVVGLPISLILSWVFDITPDGIVRAQEDDTGNPALSTTQTYSLLGGMFVAVAVILYLIWPQTSPPPPTAVDNSIAVLPFVNMSSDEEQEYFSDGLSEELLNLLAGIPELSVAARTSSFSFKDKDLEITEIASRLKVAHILEGSVRKYGNQMRITAQLIRADNGYHLWSETYDRQLDNVFQTQEDIANAVVEAMRITLLGEAPKSRRADPRAYQLFLEGRYLRRQIGIDSLLGALEALKQAVQIDPSYAPAWAEMADTYFWISHRSEDFTVEEGIALADQAIEMAINIDPGYAHAYYVRGASWLYKKNNFKQGIADFEYAVELEPNNAELVAAIGKGALVTGKFDLAITQMQAALALETVPEFYYHLGRAYLGSGRLDEAESSFRKMMELAASGPGQFFLWETLLVKGDLEAALAESGGDYRHAVTQYALGNAVAADQYVADIVNSTEEIDGYALARVYGFRGDADKTFEWLDYALEENNYYPTFILAETAFHSVHSDPRWELFLEKLDLLEYWREMTPD